MMQYILNPQEGVCREDGAWIRFHDTRAQVEAILGEPEDTGANTYLYNDNTLQISFDDNGTVEFIDFLGGFGSGIHPVIFGADAFAADANEVIALIKAQSSDWKEDCMEYTFFDLSLGLMRGGMPGDLEKFIAELQEDGIDPESEFGKEQIACEEMQIRYCQCIGIGVKGYYEEFR